MITKKCKKCEQIKLLQEFTKDKQCKDGTTNVCKVCTNLRRKRHREANPEQVAKMYAKNKIWKQNNRKTILEQAKHNYKARTPEQKAEAAKKYKSSEKGKIARATYNRKRTENVTAYSDGTISRKTLTNLLEEQEFKCAYCDCELNKNIPFSVHLDHITLISKGGHHSLHNVVWSCVKCNLSKSNSLIIPS